MQKQLIREVCEEAGVSGTDIVYMEAHGTGTRAGDPQEAGAFADLLCDGRKEPLLIGSIKSNLGHTEPVSGQPSERTLFIIQLYFAHGKKSQTSSCCTDNLPTENCHILLNIISLCHYCFHVFQWHTSYIS